MEEIYRLVFPIHEGVNSFAIVPDSVGVIAPQIWHRTLLKQFSSIPAAFDLALKIFESSLNRKPCPCFENCKYSTSQMSFSD